MGPVGSGDGGLCADLERVEAQHECVGEWDERAEEEEGPCGWTVWGRGNARVEIFDGSEGHDQLRRGNAGVERGGVRGRWSVGGWEEVGRGQMKCPVETIEARRMRMRMRMREGRKRWRKHEDEAGRRGIQNAHCTPAWQSLCRMRRRHLPHTQPSSAQKRHWPNPCPAPHTRSPWPMCKRQVL